MSFLNSPILHLSTSFLTTPPYPHLQHDLLPAPSVLMLPQTSFPNPYLFSFLFVRSFLVPLSNGGPQTLLGTISAGEVLKIHMARSLEILLWEYYLYFFKGFSCDSDVQQKLGTTALFLGNFTHCHGHCLHNHMHSDNYKSCLNQCFTGSYPSLKTHIPCLQQLLPSILEFPGVTHVSSQSCRCQPQFLCSPSPPAPPPHLAGYCCIHGHPTVLAGHHSLSSHSRLLGGTAVLREWAKQVILGEVSPKAMTWVQVTYLGSVPGI